MNMSRNHLEAGPGCQGACSDTSRRPVGDQRRTLQSLSIPRVQIETSKMEGPTTKKQCIDDVEMKSCKISEKVGRRWRRKR